MAHLTALYKHCVQPDEVTSEHEQREHSGQRAQVIGRVDPDTYDYYDVGDMYHVRFEDGTEFEAFGDELSAWEGRL